MQAGIVTRIYSLELESDTSVFLGLLVYFTGILFFFASESHTQNYEMILSMVNFI